jgi:hypothetical protein
MTTAKLRKSTRKAAAPDTSDREVSLAAGSDQQAAAVDDAASDHANARRDGADEANGAASAPEGADVKERIRQRAFELFSSRGFGDGNELDDWLAAEREVRNGHGLTPAPAPLFPDHPADEHGQNLAE